MEGFRRWIYHDYSSSTQSRSSNPKQSGGNACLQAGREDSGWSGKVRIAIQEDPNAAYLCRLICGQWARVLCGAIGNVQKKSVLILASVTRQGQKEIFR
eukprot:scaffold16160_cov54-Cylindrotheca_fusiformis.AAC.3